ncbi:nuclear pore complex protein GP210-like isoform X1 [Camellia sinensis]|uniref:nuclear pore complex protein GP210-like isoform X1 n=1 Tax=Camellia sinensis TaxID=4442 RepID=UPI0010365675|nr:nuclear pore complex protein GP210-like isoform X1 [Camellia sinensis]
MRREGEDRGFEGEGKGFNVSLWTLRWYGKTSSAMITINVGSHLYPKNLVLHLGNQLNFSVEGLNDQVFGRWLSANESVIYVDMISGKDEAIREVIFKNSSLKLQTAVTVLKGTIVFIDDPKEMLTNVPIPAKGFSFPVRFGFVNWPFCLDSN